METAEDFYTNIDSNNSRWMHTCIEEWIAMSLMVMLLWLLYSCSTLCITEQRGAARSKPNRNKSLQV